MPPDRHRVLQPCSIGVAVLELNRIGPRATQSMLGVDIEERGRSTLYTTPKNGLMGKFEQSKGKISSPWEQLKWNLPLDVVMAPA